jgi:hypothetical protein
VSLATDSEQVIAGRSNVYSISSWLDEQLRNPLATHKRPLHGYHTTAPLDHQSSHERWDVRWSFILEHIAMLPVIAERPLLSNKKRHFSFEADYGDPL